MTQTNQQTNCLQKLREGSIALRQWWWLQRQVPTWMDSSDAVETTCKQMRYSHHVEENLAHLVSPPTQQNVSNEEGALSKSKTFKASAHLRHSTKLVTDTVKQLKQAVDLGCTQQL
jgi:hypothetical protein